MPVGREQTIKEIERMLAEVRKPRKPRVELPAPEVEEPKEIPGLRRRLAEGQPVFFTPKVAEAFDLKVDIDPDWLLKVTPGKNGDQPTISYKSPEGVEFQPEEIFTREGKWLSSAELEEIRSRQFQAFDPETRKFRAVTRAFVEAREEAGLTPQELREIASGQFLVKDIDTGESVPTTEAGVARREEFYRVKARQDELTSLFEGVLPELLAPYTEEQKTDITLAFIGQMIETPEMQEQFFETVQAKGRTPETERLLQILLPEATEEELAEFFGATAVVDVFGHEITLRRPDWWTLDFWLENFFKPYGGKDLKGKAAASFIAGIGDVISTSGGAARWLGYEDVGKTLTDIGTPLQRFAPPDISGEFEVADLLDPEFYATKIVRTIPFALSLAPLAIGGYFGGAAVATALGIGRIGAWIVGGLAGAALSRPAESALEAGGAYDDAIARGKTEAEAKKEADEVFRNNMLLAGADAFEIAIALAPTPKWVPTALVKSGLVRTATVAGKMVIVGLTEGGEEVYQDMITRRARGEDWQLDPIAKEVFAIGMVMGMGMGLSGDVISSIVSRSKGKMSPELKKDFEIAVSDFEKAGFTTEQSELRGLDRIAEIPEGEEIIKEAIKAEEKAVVAKPEVPPAVPAPEVKPPVTPEVKPPPPAEVPEGWRIEIGEIKIKPGMEEVVTGKAMVDWRRKVIVVRDAAVMRDVAIINHEIAHIRLEELPDDVRQSAISEFEVAAKYEPIEVRSEFARREGFGQEYGNYLSDPSSVSTEIGAVFEKYFPVAKPTPVAPERVVTPPVTPEVTEIVPSEYEPLKAISNRINRRGYNPDVITDDAINTLKKQGLITGIKNIKLTREGLSKLTDWDRLVEQQRLAEGTAADLVQEAITEARIAAEVVPPAVEEVARPEPGMPEPGIQPTMIPEVPAKEVRPKAKARVVQISMEDQLKLEQARRAAEEAPPELREAYEAQAELEGLEEWLATEPATNLVDVIKKTGWYKGEVSNLTLKQYRDITGKRVIQPNILTKDKKHVRWEYALDEIATEMGYPDGDALKEAIERAGEARARIKALKSEVKAHFTEKPLPSLPEPTPEEVRTLTPTGEQMITPAQQVRTLELFGKYVESESVVDAWELTRDLRRETRGARAEALKNRAQELIVSEGLDTEEAMNQAKRETMAGELPVATTDYLSDLTTQMRATLFDKVYQTLENEPFEMMSTAEALTNALLGKAIPREPGVKGGSAFTRLQHVFGEQPQVMKALDKIAKEGKSLEDVVEGIFHETGREPMPVDQKMADYLRGLSSDIVYSPTAFREPIPVAKYEAPIDDAIKQVPMWPTPVRDNIIRVLKEIGWSPIDIGNFIRANKASFDMSFWRQQGPLILNHPISFVQSNIEAWKALFSQKAAEASWERISRDPLFQIYEVAEEAGYDFLRPLELKKGTSQWRGVEEFGYLTGERLIPKLTGKIPHVKLSARAFVTGTNEHNWRIFKNHYESMLRLNEKYASGELKLKVGQSFNIEKEMVDMARMLADFTQRASLGRVSGIIPALNSLIFAPRATLGRFLTPRHLISANPHIRMEAWRDLTAFVSGIGSIVLLGNLLGLWEVEKDPRSAEFMSIRVGKTRLDPWSGYRQFLVFYTRIITKTGLSSVTGAEYNINPLMAMTSFVRGKAAPLASILLDFWVGKNFIGEEVDIANKRQWAERISPFSVWDIYEAYMNDPTTAWQITIPAIVGAGVQTYTGNWEENWTKMGLPKYSDNLVYGLTEPAYDAKDFWSDTAGQFRGVDPATLTEAKGFPPYIRAIAEARIIKEHLSTLPNERLVSLNADPDKDEGKTFAVYYQQWKDREKLVAADDEDALKAFDQDERTRNAERGNFSQRQFALLNEYWGITDEEKQDEFLEEHKDEIGINPRQDWLRSRPKENAQLAIWGQANLLSIEAYHEAVKLGKELDMPEIAYPEKTIPPEGSIESYAKYQDVITQPDRAWNSWEAQIIYAQDDALREFLGFDPVETPVRSLELKIKGRKLSEQYDTLEADEDRAKLKTDNPKWVDDMRRIEAIEHIASDADIEAWVGRGKVVDEFTAGSSEAKVWLLDNPGTFKWAIDQGLLTDDGSGWNADVLRLNVEMTKLDEESEEFKQLQIKKRAYQKVPEGMVEQYVEYYNLPIRGYRQERYLIEHPEFTKAVGLKMPKAVPSVKYDELLEKADQTPEDLTRMKGYKLFVPEKYIDRFVDYDTIRAQGKPPDYPEGIRYYEDEWYLFDHPLFYKEIYTGLLGLDEVNFDNVPTPDQRRVYTPRVFSLYATLKGLPQGTARREFELSNPDLDLFMHIEFGTILESERAKVERKVKAPVERKETARERIQRELKELEERLKR